MFSSDLGLGDRDAIAPLFLTFSYFGVKTNSELSSPGSFLRTLPNRSGAVLMWKLG